MDQIERFLKNSENSRIQNGNRFLTFSNVLSEWAVFEFSDWRIDGGMPYPGKAVEIFSCAQERIGAALEVLETGLVPARGK